MTVIVLNLKGVKDVRELSGLELDVNDGTNNGTDLTDTGGGSGERASCCRSRK